MPEALLILIRVRSRTLSRKFTRVFGIFAGLWEVSIRILQHRVLIPMAKLLLQADVALAFVILCFLGTLCRILIGSAL